MDSPRVQIYNQTWEKFRSFLHMQVDVNQDLDSYKEVKKEVVEGINVDLVRFKDTFYELLKEEWKT